jgi:hypothetical protein
MAFTPLANRIGTMPLLICGPILRRVTSSSVTVWLVTREAATVTLTVFRPADLSATQVLPPPPTKATRATTPIGQKLHMVALTARGPEGTLQEGQVYSYDLTFDFQQSGHKKFNEAASVDAAMTEYAYAPYTLPTFALPPANLEKVRLIHGSCRKPNGGGEDMLAFLDDLIEATADQPLGRPHQLLMTGDQIYADEVADVLLLMLTDAGDTLLGWLEAMPTTGGVPLFAAGLKPGKRSDVVKGAGFTSDDTRSHLMALGEYLAMYLFAWSPTLWPNTLPVPESDLPLPDAQKDPIGYLNELKLVKEQLANVKTYLGTLTKVRRALANVPSYMICDDHEVTDDWNMTREFCEDVYGDPLGRRVMQNGLVAYALCQGWGNTPEQFEDDPQKPAGQVLLSLLANASSGTYASNSAQIQRTVGLHDAATLAQQTGNYAVYHEGGFDIVVQGVHVNTASINFHYTIEAAAFQIIVTDTRTWRSWSKTGKVEHSDLLSAANLIGQLDITPSLGTRLQMVVVTTNMPPIPGIRQAEAWFSWSDHEVYENDMFDSWRFPSASFDLMITKLTDRLALDSIPPPASDSSGPPAPTHVGRVIILSGDVHSSYASRLAYWANKRFGDVPSSRVPGKAVFAQLVASPFKNASKSTLGQHSSGYSYAPYHLSFTLPKIKPEGVVGWALDPLSTQRVKVGTIHTTSVVVDSTGGATTATVPVPLEVSGDDPSRSFENISGSHALHMVYLNPSISTPADYEYRSDQIFAAAVGQAPGLVPTISPVGPAGDAAARKAALGSFNQGLSAYRNYKSKAGRGRQIVGRSNICEITFTWGAGDDKQVHHTVRWFEKDGDTSTVSWARYSVSLALNDDPHWGKVSFP